MDNNMKKMIMMEHYSNPFNKGLVQDERYLKTNMNSASCIDNLDFMFLIEDGKIKDVKFDGEACAISTSSSSIMSELVKGKTIEEAKEIIENYENMIEEKAYNRSLLDEANCYDEIYKQPNRKKCATLPYEALKKIIKEKEEN